MKAKQIGIKFGIYLCFILLPFGIFYRQIPFISQSTIGRDYVEYPIENQLDLQFSLKHGTFPLYVPGYAGGRTAAALTQGQMYHPFFYIYGWLPGYWQGNALQWNTLFRLLSLGVAHLLLFTLLTQLRLPPIISFIISFITVYNLRMLDLFRYGSSLENYKGYLFLCTAIAFYYIKPTRFKGPAFIIGATYLLICGGHPQMMYLAAIGVGICIMGIPFILPKILEDSGTKYQFPSYKKYFFTVGGSLVAGILLSAAYVLPFYTDFLLSTAPRLGQSYKWSLEFSDTLGGMINNFFNPVQSDVHGAFGSSSLLLLIVLLPIIYIRERKGAIPVSALWACFVLIFLCSLGKVTPVHYYYWKYFPFADVFRCPPRITIAFPFLFLLLLACRFRKNTQQIKIGYREIPFSFYGLLAFIAIPIFILYHKVWGGLLPVPGPFTPQAIQKVPGWVEPTIFWLGLVSLIFVLGHSFHFKGNRIIWCSVTGILLAAAVVSQVTIQIRFGTWIYTTPSPQFTLEKIKELKKKKLTFVCSEGISMESDAVITQRKFSIVERRLALFYRKFRIVRKQQEAYRVLAKKDVTGKVIIENPLAERKNLRSSLSSINSNEVDSLVLDANTYNQLQFTVNAGAAGFFVLSFPFSKHWSAEVDGEKSPIYRANGYMQAVHLLPGKHQVRFRYWSDSALIGMMVSCLTLIAIGFFFAFPLERKKQWTWIVVFIVISSAIFLFWLTRSYQGENLKSQYNWDSYDFPHAGNLAYAKRTKMSSGEEGVNYAGIGVDGNFTKPFRTGNYHLEWWQVDLGTPKEIGEIVLYDEQLSGKKQLPLSILGSLDGKNFTLLKLLTDRGQAIPWRITFQGEAVRFIRLQPPPKTVVSFNEIEVYPFLRGNIQL